MVYIMATYEVESVFYNNYGGVKTKSCDLFGDKTKAVKHMKQLTKNKHGLKQRGDIKDGSVDFVDDTGKVKERIIFGEL
jgi:hypothetical protein